LRRPGLGCAAIFGHLNLHFGRAMARNGKMSWGNRMSIKRTANGIVNRAAGFTIIEVLVVMLVLAIGVIGSSAMQLTALRTRHQSSLLSNAVQLGASMLDTMRANARQMQLSDVDNPYLGLDDDALVPAAPAGAVCFAQAQCDSAQLAAFDIAQWQRQLRASLPGGRFVVCRDDQVQDGASSIWSCSGSPAAPIVIKLGWTEGNFGMAQSGVQQIMLVLTLTGGPT
jgi:type IV pilus assembly protein PilV